MVRMRLEPQDDYLHAVEEASNFNESRYYNFFDPGAGMGGWVRMGNRPNEGYAEMTVCLYLPDGRVGVHVQAPAVSTDTTPTTPAACASRWSRPTRSTASPTTARCACWPSRARWPIRRARSTTTRTRRAPIDLDLKAVGTAVGRRARVGGGRGEARPRSREDVRPRPHRAAHGDHGHGRGRRRDVRDHRRARPARPLVGPALLAEHLVVPVAHREPRARARLRAARSPATEDDPDRSAPAASSTTSPATATTSGCRSATAS